MKTEGIMSSVQNGQVVKKARSTRTNAPNDFDFMSVMNTVSLDDISTGTGSSYDSSSRAVNTRAESTLKPDTSTTSRKEVSVYTSTKNASYSKVIDSAKTTKTDGQKTAQKSAAKADSSDKTTDIKKSADKGSSVKTDDRDTKVEDKDTKAAGPETEDDKVERPEAVNDLISDILNTISNDLGVSEDDITDAMNTLGLSFADLSIPSNTAELYKALTGSDSVSLLTSDDFMSLLDDLQDIFSGVDDDLMSQLTPLTDDEASDLTDLISQQDVTDEAAEQSDVTVINVTSEETTEVTETTETVVSVTTETVTNADSSQQSQTTDSSADETQNGTITNTAQQTTAADEKASSDTSDLFENSSEQKSGADQVNVNAVSAGTAQAEGETEVTDFISTIQKYTDINTDDLISQIVDKARQTLSSRVSSLEMELHPQSLGKIFLQVTEKSGDVTAHLYAQNEAVKHALENRLADLTEDLNRQGVRVNEVTISVEPHAFDENLEKNMSNQFGNNPNSGTQSGTFEGEASSRGNRSRSTIDLRNGALSDDMTSDEALEASIMQDNGNTVSYRI